MGFASVNNRVPTRFILKLLLSFSTLLEEKEQTVEKYFYMEPVIIFEIAILSNVSQILYSVFHSSVCWRYSHIPKEAVT